MSKKNSIQSIKREDPAFIRRFKQQVGYKEGPTVDSKRAPLERDDSGSDLEDEKPSIVVLKKGDLTEEEVERLKEEGKSLEFEDKEDQEEESPADGKIVFKKPTKRKSETPGKTEPKKKKSGGKKIKNKSLLSFDEEEGDDC